MNQEYERCRGIGLGHPIDLHEISVRRPNPFGCEHPAWGGSEKFSSERLQMGACQPLGRREMSGSPGVLVPVVSGQRLGHDPPEVVCVHGGISRRMRSSTGHAGSR